MEFGFPELASIRLGYGLSPHVKPPATADDLLAGVADSTSPAPDGFSLEEANRIAIERSDIQQAIRENRATRDALEEKSRELRRMVWWDVRRRAARAVDAYGGFGERLVQFWADHFTIRADGGTNQPLALAFADEAIRPHLNGRFEEMFFAADTHPMMLIYLNQNTSIGPNSRVGRRQVERRLGLNENLAREALELHSLGVGAGYTQQDVRELAELLTGLVYNARRPGNFRPIIAEDGAETILGRTYGGDGPASIEDIRAALTDIARRPETATHLSRKLIVHFFTDSPDERTVDEIASVWRDTQGDLPQVYRALTTHPVLADSFRQKARQPIDFVFSGLRALGVTGGDIRGWEDKVVQRTLIDPLARMGQRWGAPLGPNGWPEEAGAWIRPQTLAARINWSMNVPGQILSALPDPRELLDTALGGTQSAALAWAVPKAESEREGVALVLASNDFNRR